MSNVRNSNKHGQQKTPRCIYNYYDNHVSFKIIIDSISKNRNFYCTMILKNIGSTNDTVYYYNLPTWRMFLSEGDVYCSIADNNQISETKEELMPLIKPEQISKSFKLDSKSIKDLHLSFSYFLNFNSNQMEIKMSKEGVRKIEIDHGYSFTGKYFEIIFPVALKK